MMFLLVFALIGCDQPVEDDSLAKPDYDFTGFWAGTLTGATFATSFNASATMDGNAIYGSMATDAGFTFDVTGKAWGDNIELVCTDIDNAHYILRCKGISDGEYVTGTWSDTASQSGTWEAWK